jgi:hypothetical protein
MNELSSTDQAFINKLTGIILANLENEHFDINELSKAAGIPRSFIHQRLLAVLCIPTNKFVREVRLK